METKKIVYTALFAALICALTMFPTFPIPVFTGAYIHLGDALIILAVLFIGKYAVLSAAVGSTLADLLLGAVNYAPATFFIKALMALSVLILFYRKKNVISFLLAAFVAEVIMLGGYFLYESILYGFSVAISSLAFGTIQGVSAIIISFVIYIIIKDSKFFNRFKIN